MTIFDTTSQPCAQVFRDAVAALMLRLAMDADTPAERKQRLCIAYENGAINSDEIAAAIKANGLCDA